MKILNVRSLLIGVLVASPAFCNLVQNGQFQPGPGNAFTTVSAGATQIPNWTVLGGSVDWIGSYWQEPVAGGYSVDLDGNSVSGISQTVTGLTNGGTYTLSFMLSGNPDGSPATKLLDVSAGSVAASNTPNFSFAVGGTQSKTNMEWVSESLVFQAVGNSATITFQSLDTPGSNPYGPVIGDVSLAGPQGAGNGGTLTPEPGFYGILGGGLAGLAFLVRRRRTA